MEMILPALMEKGWLGVVIALSLWLGSKLMDRWKPAYEERASAATAHGVEIEQIRKDYTARLDEQRGYIETLQKDVKELRDLQRDCEKQTLKMHQSIRRCIESHPQTSRFWDEESASWEGGK